MSTLESALTGLETAIVEAQKSTDTLIKTLRRLRQAARTGQLAEIGRDLPAIAAHGQDALARCMALAQSWDFDARAYLEGGYLAELEDAAREAGVTLFVRDGRIYVFPLLLRIEPRELAVKVGRKRERRLRPKEFVRQLAAMQKRSGLREQQFLDLLYRLYQRVAGTEWRKLLQGLGPVIPLADMHSILTLLPGSDYPIEEFGRDVLLLDRRPDLRTKDGCEFHFPGAAMARQRGVQPLKVYDEEGREHMYLGLSFVKEPVR